MKLNETAFYLLGATVHRSKTELRHLAEEKSFSMEESLCRAAEREICLPSKRVVHELSWLPGVDPAAASEVAQRALTGAAPLRYRRGEVWVPLPPLALCNVLAAGLPARKTAPVTDETQTQTAFLLRTMAESYEALRAEDIAETLNADREVAGFPTLAAAAVQEPLATRRRELVSELGDYLFSLPEEVGVGALTEAVTECSHAGAAQNPLLLDELVAAHELHAESTLRSYEMSVRSAAEQLRDGEDAEVACGLELLEEKLRMWDALVQPIQISAKSRGLCHEPSRRLATDLHHLVRKLCERPACAAQAAALSRLLAEVFAEVPEVQDMLLADVAYAATELPAKTQMPTIMKGLHAYRTPPEDKASIIARAEDAESHLLSLFQAEELCDASSDWFALLLMRYAAALVNRHQDTEGGLVLLRRAKPYIRSAQLHLLWSANCARTEKNASLRALVEKREKQLNAAADARYAERRGGHRRKVLRVWVAQLLLLFVAACVALYVRSESYMWNYVTHAAKVEDWQFYLSACPQGPHVAEARQHMEKMLRQALDDELGNGEPAEYKLRLLVTRFGHLGLFDPEPVCAEHMRESHSFAYLAQYEGLFPKGAHLAEVRALLKEWATEALCRVGGPYTDEQLENFLKEYRRALTKEDTEPIVYADMCGRESADYYRSYAQLYPEGKHAADVQNRLRALVRQAWNKEPKPYTRPAVMEFSKSHPEMPEQEIQREVTQWLLTEGDLETRRSFCAWVSDVDRRQQLKELIYAEERKLWADEWCKLTDEKRLNALADEVLEDDIRRQLRERSKNLYRDFEFVSRMDTAEAYEKYLTLCPQSPQAAQAKKRLIDLQVAEIAAGKHGDLPASTPVASHRRGSKASLAVKNDTSYPITVLYSGPDSQKLEIPARTTRSLSLKVGNYRVAVTTTQPGVHPFYGESKLTAGEYEETFYIRTQKVRSYYPSYYHRLP